MIKKIFALVLTLLLVCSLAACKEKEKKPDPSEIDVSDGKFFEDDDSITSASDTEESTPADSETTENTTEDTTEDASAEA